MVECLGKALILPKDMKHWEKWDANSLLINVKREAIKVTRNSYLTFFDSLFFLLLNLNFL